MHLYCSILLSETYLQYMSYFCYLFALCGSALIWSLNFWPLKLVNASLRYLFPQFYPKYESLYIKPFFPSVSRIYKCGKKTISQKHSQSLNFLNSNISRSIMMKDSVKNEANLISSNYANFNQRCSISVAKGRKRVDLKVRLVLNLIIFIINVNRTMEICKLLNFQISQSSCLENWKSSWNCIKEPPFIYDSWILVFQKNVSIYFFHTLKFLRRFWWYI